MAHPYHPKSLVMPNYVPNENTVAELLGIFFGLVTIVLVVFWLYTGRRPGFSLMDRFKLCWFLVCGFIHVVLEGYFSLFSKTLVSESSYLAQMWKEYGKGDSRYVTSETCMVCVESITALVDGPLCFLTVVAFFTGSSYRYVIQMIVSLCQLYGDTMYFFTEFKEGFIHSEVGHPLYFWFYMIFLNSLWIIIPFLMIIDSSFNIAQAQSAHDNISDKKHNVKVNTDKKKKYY